MKKYLLILVLAACFFVSKAQNRNSVWCFGDSAGIDFTNTSNPQPIITSLNTRGSCVCISDTSGSLLFYAQTRATGSFYSTQLFNRLNQVMLNGDSIRGEGWYNELIIIPNPDDTNLFYLFTVNTAGGPYAGLFYSIIDITQDNGNGAVIQKNVLVSSLKPYDALAAIKHGNGRDWWLVFKNWNTSNNVFRIYLISAGVQLHHSQNIGGVSQTNNANFTFSNNGSKAMFTTYTGLVEVMNFDRCTGYFDSAQVIEPEIISNPLKRYWGSAFSYDATKIYVSSSDDTSYLFQYDLNATNISASKDTLFTFNNVLWEGGALRLAPDNKIYMSNAWSDSVGNFNYPYPTDSASYNFINMNLSVINSPDSLGAACDFQPYSFYLNGKRTYWGLPNNPNYDLGPLTGSVCDTLTSTAPSPANQNSNLYVYYHPSWQKAFVNAQNLRGSHYTFCVYDVVGNIIFKENATLASSYFTKDLNMQHFTKGMYIVTLQTDKERLVKKFVKE